MMPIQLFYAYSENVFKKLLTNVHQTILDFYNHREKHEIFNHYLNFGPEKGKIK